MFLNINRPNIQVPSHQKGSMLIIAIVVMTVVLLLGLAMTRVLASSSNSVVYEVLGFRAFNAARSGLESNLMSILNAPSVGGSATPPRTLCMNQASNGNGGIVNSASSFGSIQGFENCRYETRCSVRDVNDNGTMIPYFRFTSTGFCAVDGQNQVTRTVSVDARL